MKKFIIILIFIFISFNYVSANGTTEVCKSLDNDTVIKTNEFLNKFEEGHFFTDKDVIDYYEFIGQKVDYVEDDSIYNFRSYDDYFYWSKWINRDGIWSLSIMPKNVILIRGNTYDSWNYIYNKHSGSKHWQKYSYQDVDKSMNRQYACHILYGALKTPWNLEPHKKYENLNFITSN